MNRRSFFQSLPALGGLPALAALAGHDTAQSAQPGQTAQPFPVGINTYCLRAMRWNDDKLLDYAAGLKCDAIFLQDSPDPASQDPAHWPVVRRRAQELGLHLETGGGATLPRRPDLFDERVTYLKGQIRRAAALGSPIVRTLCASDRYALPPGSLAPHIDTMVRVLEAVRDEALRLQVKVAVEVHKELQAWEFAELIERAGPDFTGIYLDTGNPVFVMEHPLTTVETLGKYALTLHLRDSVVYQHPHGIAVQWVPLGEGTVDFKEILTAARERCPNVHVYSKPITGRPPVVIPVWDEAHWKKWFPRARSNDFARFVSLSKQGVPYDRPMVVEDLQGRPVPPQFVEAVQHQQRDHVERSLRYAQETLGLGRRWRA